MPNITEADLKKQIKAKQFSPVYLLCGSEQMYVRTYAHKLEGCIHDGWLAFYDYKGISKEYLYYYLEADTTMKQFTTTVYSDSKNG